MEKLLEYLRDQRKRKLITRTIFGLACVVFFVSTYILIYPALTMENTPVCGQEVHTHTDDC